MSEQRKPSTPEQLARRREYYAKNRERRLAKQREWNANNEEKRRAARQKWDDKNPTYKTEYYAKNREKDLEQKRRKRISDNAAKARRKKDSERATQWGKANPEKRREARARWKEQNPEAAREAQRAYYQRNKAKIRERTQARLARTDPDELRGLRRRQNAAYRNPHTSDWTPTEEQRQRNLARSREKRRLERRLARAGLPPSSVHRTLVSERRGNSDSADEFFRRKRSADEVDQIKYGAIDPVSESEQREWESTVAHFQQRRTFRTDVEKYVRKHGRTLREEIAMDSRARELRGKSPIVDVDRELRRRAIEAVRLTRVAPSAELAERVHRFANIDRPLRGSDLAHRAPSDGKVRGSTSVTHSQERGLGR